MLPQTGPRPFPSSPPQFTVLCHAAFSATSCVAESLNNLELTKHMKSQFCVVTGFLCLCTRAKKGRPKYSKYNIKIPCKCIFLDSFNGATWKYTKVRKIQATFFPRYPEAHKALQVEKKWKYLYIQCSPIYETVLVLDVFQVSRVFLLVRATSTWRWVWSIGGTTIRKNWITLSEIYPCAIFATTNLIRTLLLSNPRLGHDRPTTNSPYHGMAI